MSSEHFGRLAWQFQRVSGSSGLTVQVCDCLLMQAAFLLDGFSADVFRRSRMAWPLAK